MIPQIPILNTVPFSNSIKIQIRFRGIDFGSSCVKKSKSKSANEQHISNMVDKVNGVVVSVSKALEILGQCKSRSIRQTTVFRGALELSSECKIQVWAYCKTKSEKMREYYINL